MPVLQSATVLELVFEELIPLAMGRSHGPTVVGIIQMKFEYFLSICKLFSKQFFCTERVLKDGNGYLIMFLRMFCILNSFWIHSLDEMFAFISWMKDYVNFDDMSILISLITNFWLTMFTYALQILDNYEWKWILIE